MKHKRELSKILQRLVHICAEIWKLEIEEACIRTRKRKLFQDSRDIIDKLVLKDMNSKRKEDEI